MAMQRARPPALTIQAVDRLDFVVEPWRWRFAEERRTDIADHFAAVCVRTPQAWNGRVLLMREPALAGGVLSGRWFETGFADLVAWRDWGFPDATVTNCFAMAALRAADGAFLLGVMGGGTVNAGQIYFAAGTPDRDDVADGRVDLAGSVAREVEEEMGLTAGDYVAEPGWHAVVAGRRIALMKILAAPVTADELRTRVLANIAGQDQPELGGVHVTRGPADLDPMMPEFVKAFLIHVWTASGPNRLEGACR